MPKKLWDKDRARKLYDSGATDREIAKAVQVSLSTVGNWRRACSLPPNSERSDKRYLALYKAGRNDQQIADALGIDAKLVRAWRERRGLPPKTKTDSGEALAKDARSETAEPGAHTPRGANAPAKYPKAASPSEKSEAEETREDSAGSTKKRPTVLEAALEVFWRRGYMIGELADDLHLEPEFVAAWAAKRHPADCRKDFDTARALHLLREGKSDHEIAWELETAPRDITRWRERHDYLSHRLASFDEEKARRLFEIGRLDWEIARELGGDVTKTDVRAWREQNDLDLFGADNRRSVETPENKTPARITPRPTDRGSEATRQNGLNGDSSQTTAGKTYPQPKARTRRATQSHVPPPRSSRTRRWDTDEARNLWEEGLSDTEIARKLGTSPNSVRAWRRQNDLREPR